MRQEGNSGSHEDVDVNLLSKTKEILHDHLASNASPRIIGGIYLDLARIYERIRHYPLAHEAWEKAAEHFADSGEIYQLALTYYQHGELYREEKQGELALRKWEEILHILPSGQLEYDSLRIQTYYQMGRVWFESGEWERGRSAFAHGLVIAHKVGDLREEIRGMQGLARTFFRAGSLGLAQRIYRNALKKCLLLQDERETAWLVNDLGYLYESKFETKRAVAAFQYSLQVLQQYSDADIHGILIELGVIYLQLDPEQTKLYCQQAIDLLLDHLNHRFTERQEKRLAQIFDLMGQYCREKNDRKNMSMFWRQSMEIYHKYRMEAEWNNIYQCYSKYTQPVEIRHYNEARELVNHLPKHEKLRLRKFIG